MQLTPLLGLLCFSWSIFCLAEDAKTEEKHRQGCNKGTYEHNGIDCCLCPSGFHVLEHCTAPGTDGTCTECGLEYYSDSPNGLTVCEPCGLCLEQSNREVESKCTPFKNTVCRCAEHYYCDKGDDCTVCYACDKCEGLSVKVECSATNNTVCYKKQDAGPIVAGVLVSMFILVAALILFIYFKKKGMPSFRKVPSGPEEINIKIIKEDVDLTPFLSDISQKLGWRVVRDVARPLVTSVDMENIQRDYPNDAQEQTFQLLKTWYQNYGFDGAYNELIQKLIKKGHRDGATSVQHIVEAKQSRSVAE
ncbi:tumor necrosis factor receptor superfamily member 6 [Salminus brasiliensis]|uniref:tumor necrosis factor receptor superfamily member 6 n=1 Tax=Salminus brasiliensis TaxID=930266 RepID=UPI003B8310EE